MTSSVPGGFEALSKREACHWRSPDRDVVDAILGGDERAFLSLARRWHGSMVLVACCHGASEHLAEEVVRAAWRTVLGSLPAWQPGVSLASLILRAVAICARAALVPGTPAPTLDGAPRGDQSYREGFHQDGHPARAALPRDESEGWPAERLASPDARAALQKAIDALPPWQRLAFTVRDVMGCGPDEACDALELPEAEQRVLLHRARSQVLAAMQSHSSFGDEVSRGELQAAR